MCQCTCRLNNEEDEKFELRELQTNQLEAERTPQAQDPRSGYRQINAINEHDMLWVIQNEKNYGQF